MKVNFRSKNQVVYDRIRDAIISGELAPGERIIIDELANMLEVSHSPIRECLRQLASDGFVEIQPYSGVTVTELPTSFMTEIFAILESMEVISSTRACLRMSAEQFEELETSIKRMEQYVNAPAEWSKSNMNLHLRICDFAETVLVKETMRKTLWHWDRLRRYYLQDISAKRIAKAQEDHFEILAAMLKRDVNLVEATIRKHNRSALDSYLKHINDDEA